MANRKRLLMAKQKGLAGQVRDIQLELAEIEQALEALDQDVPGPGEPGDASDAT